MFGNLPKGILASHGYLGCLASVELGHVASDPIADAVVPSQHVVQGCQGKITKILAPCIQEQFYLDQF